MTEYELNNLSVDDTVVDSFTKVKATYEGSYYVSTRMHTIRNEEYVLDLPEKTLMDEYNVEGGEKTFADKIYEDMSLGVDLGIDENEDLLKLKKKELVGMVLHAKEDLKYAKVDIDNEHKELDKVLLQWSDLNKKNKTLTKEMKSNKKMYEDKIKELEKKLRSSTVRTITITK
jgi:CHAT domain-containing protein